MEEREWVERMGRERMREEGKNKCEEQENEIRETRKIERKQEETAKMSEREKARRKEGGRTTRRGRSNGGERHSSSRR